MHVSYCRHSMPSKKAIFPFGYSESGGVAGKVAEAFNEVVELNERLVGELERISQVVGKAGRLNQRATLGRRRAVPGHTRLHSVNTLISNLVHPTVETARVIGAVAKGDLSQTMALEINKRPLQGEFLRTAKTVNRMVNQLGSFASEVTRVAREVGTDGKLGGQAKVKGVAGTWKDLTDNVNLMAGNLTGQVRNIAAVTTAVANGDLTKKITVDVKGEFLELKRHHQHDGGSAAVVRIGSDARGPRSGYGRQARRPGHGGRRFRYVEGPHRQRELHGQ